MEIQYSKMTLYGSIRAIFYIAIPLILITILSVYNIITFSQSFIISLLIIGIIGVGLTILKRMFPKDTMTNRLIAFAVAIYQGIYLFYIFGGFTPGVKLGTYYINTVQAQVLLGLQLIAWILLGVAVVSAIQHLIEALELRKQREYLLKGKKAFKLSKLFKQLGLLLNLFMIGYILSIVISGLSLILDIHEIRLEDIGYNTGTIDPMDDTINITVSFDVRNMGIYSVREIFLDVDIYTETTTNPVILPWYTKIGEVNNVYYEKFKSLSITTNQAITVDIIPIYVPGLATTNATLRLKISFKSLYAGILINLNTSILTDWVALI
ncbi:MAG: hypothetical protein ACFE78_09600 [Candidatus Hodarchaeota archaeon]